METARFCKDDLNLKINIFVPAESIEHPAESIPNPDNIIFDFKKINTKPARKYVEITITDLYSYASPVCDEYTFDIENEADAHRIIKEFIVNKEKSPELVFQVGFCEKHRKWLESETCCKHRIASFKYDADYTYIGGYSDAEYKIKIIL
jgi:hypothetical protein